MGPRLSPEQMDELAALVSDRQDRKVPPLPQNPPLSGWDLQVHEAQERKMQERLAAAQALETRERRVRDELEAERARMWEANAEARDSARQQLEALEFERVALEERLAEMNAHRRALRAEARRWAPSAEWDAHVERRVAEERQRGLPDEVTQTEVPQLMAGWGKSAPWG